MVLLVIYFRWRRCASLDELCHNEMSRDHDAPVEYLRILASLKLRFGLAALGTAHGALPVAYPIEEQGHSATQCLRGILTFPMVALVVKLPMNVTGRQAEVHSGSASITRQSARCFVPLIVLAQHIRARQVVPIHPLAEAAAQAYLAVPLVWQLTPLYESSRRGCRSIQVAALSFTLFAAGFQQ